LARNVPFRAPLSSFGFRYFPRWNIDSPSRRYRVDTYRRYRNPVPLEVPCSEGEASESATRRQKYVIRVFSLSPKPCLIANNVIRENRNASAFAERASPLAQVPSEFSSLDSHGVATSTSSTPRDAAPRFFLRFLMQARCRPWIALKTGCRRRRARDEFASATPARSRYR